MLKLKLPAITLALALPSAPAAAERPAAAAAVSHRDLDLASAAGRAALDRRILAQAANACRRELQGSGWTPLEMHVCVLDTAARARPSVDRAIARAEDVGRSTGKVAAR